MVLLRSESCRFFILSWKRKKKTGLSFETRYPFFALIGLETNLFIAGVD